LPYGQTDQERHVIHRIRLLRRTRKRGLPGLTMQAIADQLNTDGIPTRFGKRWSAASVCSILHRK
jgi:hypothetical protein